MKYRVAKKILKLKDRLSYRKDQIARAEAIVAKRKGLRKQKEARGGKAKSKGRRQAKGAQKEEVQKEIEG